MPELPEVETIARDLDHYLPHKTIAAITVIPGSGTMLQTPIATLKKKLAGQKVSRVFRRAKMLIIETKDYALVFHLKMTGQLIYTEKKPLVAGGHPIISTGVTVPNKFTRVVFNFKPGGILYFNDIRKFGWLKLLTREEFKQLEAKTGIEPLSSAFTLNFFQKMVQGRRAPIKAVLLDQKKLVGLGNIYVDEVLFRSQVRPHRLAASLQPAEIKRIWQSIPVVLKHSIKQRGTTFSNFLDPDGLRGNFMNFLKVYGRGQKACVVCGRPLRKTRVAGRGTHWCEHCQH